MQKRWWERARCSRRVRGHSEKSEAIDMREFTPRFFIEEEKSTLRTKRLREQIQKRKIELWSDVKFLSTKKVGDI